MRIKTLLITTFLFASSAVWAESSLLENVAKQAAKDTARAAAPGAVEKAEQANQALENAKAAKQQTTESVKNVKKQAANAPKAVEQKAKQKAAEKTLELLR